MAEDTARLPATELVTRFVAGDLSPVDATQACLDRIGQTNPALNAMNLVDADGALAAARQAEKRYRAGTPLSPIDGVPITIKDIVLVRGWPTRRGSRTIDPDQPWLEDAPAPARLREAGAVPLGRTTTPEFGWKGVTDSPLTGITRNPWDRDKAPGGSSGGAAVAAAVGMAPLNIGTDGGGSIRIPAAFTGIFGFKPSFGRVPAYPPSPFGTLAHLGPMTRTVADAAAMLTVMARPDPRDWHARPYGPEDFARTLDAGVGGLRIGFAPTLDRAQVDPEIARLVAEAAAVFETLGATVEEVAPPLADAARVFDTLWAAGAAAVYRTVPADRRDRVDPGFRAVAEAAGSMPAETLHGADLARGAIGGAMNRFFGTVDLLLTPAEPIAAFEAGHDVPPGGPYRGWPDWTPFTYPFNLTQQPAASVPCGLTAAGLPAGLQIVGPAHQDALVLRAAAAFERARPWPLSPIRW